LFCRNVTVFRSKLTSPRPGLVDEAKAAAQFAIDWRNRRLAHRDLDLALRRSLRPLEPATRERVDAALAALVAVMNRVELRISNSTTMYGRPAVPGTAEEICGEPQQELRILVDSAGRQQAVDPTQ
jgi:hypothetical protein